MKKNPMKKIPEPSKKRLILLAKILAQLDQEKITSVALERITGWKEATIRRDISLLELHSGVSNGYETKKLQESICDFLKIEKDEKKHRCCIVGLGKLGEAFLDSSIFDRSNFELVAGFDTNFNKIEMMKSDIPLFATLDLERKIRTLDIEFAILAVPDEKAQFMANRLSSYGIKGIINCTNVILSLPDEIKVENMNVILSLTEMLLP